MNTNEHGFSIFSFQFFFIRKFHEFHEFFNFLFSIFL